MSNILKDSEKLEKALTIQLDKLEKSDIIEKLVRYYSHTMEVDSADNFANNDNELIDMIFSEGHEILTGE